MTSTTANKNGNLLNLKLPQANYIKSVVVLAAAYVITAKLGLLFATTNGNITMIWPASGIALAALIIFGVRLWPGVLIGAYIADYIATESFMASIGMCIGATGSAVFGYWLVNKFIGKENPLSSVISFYKFLIIAALSTGIAAHVGVTSLAFTNIVEWSNYLSVSTTWWIGDTAGILIFTPFIIAWQKNIQPPMHYIPNYLEISAFTILLILVSSLPFLSTLPTQTIGYPLAFVSFPFCIWAAYRYCMKQVSLTIIIIMFLAIYGTVTEQGPFYRENLSDSLFQLQTFMAIIVITTLSLASAIFERQKFEMQLIAEKKNAEELTKAKSQFMSNMSHELRTPLNAIIGFSHILKKNDTSLNKQHDEFVGYISDAGNHLLHLVNDLLAIEQGDANKLHIESTQINLHEPISESIHFIEPMAAKRNISIHYDESSCQNLTVIADKVRLRQVLINLLSNAAKYNHDGGSISISCDKSDSSYTRVTIADSGEGIAEQDIEKIFEPFSRLKIEDSRIEGSGIGLTVANRLVELMNGTITVNSQPEKGSTFTIELPA